MRRRVRIAAVTVAVALLAAAALLANAALRDRALPLETPEARLARLAPHWRLARPEGRDDAPVAILLSGCDGPGDNMDLWAETLAEIGWATLTLDSHGPRGFDRLQSWRLVCSGQALSGAERAGDVAVALAALGETDEVDGARVALLGASHGGWTAMELMDRLWSEAPPPGLTAWPEPRAKTRARLKAAIHLYPYCGPLNGAAVTAAGVPTLMILAGDDTIVSAARCAAAAARATGDGAAVRVEILSGVDHGFDQRVHAVFSTLSFDRSATAQAAALVTGFLGPLAKETR